MQLSFSSSSPWTFVILAGCLVVLAALVNRFVPRKKKRIRRATILLACYGTCLAIAALLRLIHADGWSRRVAYGAEIFEVLAIIDLVAIFLFDLLLLGLRIELADIVHDLARGGAYLLAVFSILHRAGMDLSGLVATSAVLTVVLGLSLQATLGNVLGGVALQLDDSLHAGDWVQLQNGVQGRIKAIRWRHAVLETRNWDTVIVPNSALLSEQITVLGLRQEHPLQHRMWVWFHVDYRHSPDEVIRAVDESLQAAPIPDAAQDPRPHCLCMDLAKDGTSGVAAYAVRYWVRDLSRDDATSSEVRCRIFAALRRAKIPLALPGHAVFVSQDDPEHEARKESREMAQRLVALEQLELFRGLSEEERQELARGMRFAPFGRGEVITRQGSMAHWLYVLVKGQAEVRVRAEPEGEKSVARLDAPDVFGEMGVVTGEPRTASVVATTDVECYRIDRETFQRLMARRQDLAAHISEVMAKRRVELAAVRDHLDAEGRARRAEVEQSRMLRALQSFFGMGDES
jgi:CRP-like cAMP-binding protein/small-conductance mechanosensitive channel